ncbi:MAG: MBL fold metallo-hydrolase [Actinomycetota bacterium]|nr:MBL fold metallo-hydrolase [Actinomycetota bacterium]
MKTIIRTGGAAVAGVAATWVTRAAWGLPEALGASPAALRAVAEGSPQYRDGKFVNAEMSPIVTAAEGGSMLVALLTRGDGGRPAGAVPLARSGRTPEPVADLAATWYGHATALLEVDGQRVLLDPVWGDRVSPSRTVGPRRLHPPPVPIEDLPALDAVLISHDHYDHLDLPTVRSLTRTQIAPFVVPLGVGAHLRRWGVPDERIIELDWGQAADVGGLRLTCSQARHFSGRGLSRDNTLWSSWVICGPRHRAYFGGDTGYTSGFAGIGAEYGPFGLTLLPIGAYGDQWPHIHMNPEEAVRAHRDLGGELLLPIHWATFDLAFHGWAEPVQRLCVAAAEAGVSLALPRPGERVSQDEPAPTEDWWTALARPQRPAYHP